MIGAKGLIAVAAVGVALLGFNTYSDWSSRNAADARMVELESQIQSLRDTETSRISELTTQIDAVQSRVGVTAEDVANYQKSAAAARKEQARAEAALKQAIDEHAKGIEAVREQSTAGLQEVRQEATSKVAEVGTQVAGVKTDLDATRTDLANSRSAMSKEINDVRDSLGRQIAHNADELSVLKRRGERDYFEFDLRKTKDMARVAGIRLQLTKTDPKARRYDVTLQVDDNKLQKKGQLINEPIQLNVGKDRARYELIVNFIDKDHIRGYISTPKDSASPAIALQD
jgi:molecular chaperone GrpE (heat shock protein)